MATLLMIAMSWFITPVTESGTMFGRGGEITVERELAGNLYRIDLPNSRVTAIANPVERKGLTSLELAPRSRLLLVTWFELDVGYSMEIMDFDGNVLKRMNDVHSAVFIDDAGRRIAIAKSIYTYGENLKSEGVWIYDFDTNREEKILDAGLHLEWGKFDNSLYVRLEGEGGTGGIRYDLSTKKVAETVLGTGAFSPDGEYRWAYKDGEIRIFRRVTGEVVSEDFALLKSQMNGTPVWMRDYIIMLPHSGRDLEDRLLDVESGRSLKAPGRILSVTDDEQFVYICKPGLVLEKVAVQDLEVLYDGNSKDTGVEEGEKQ